MAASMADVLAEHPGYSQQPDGWRCNGLQCGWKADDLRGDRTIDDQHRVHVAAALAAAGFGDVAQARTDALNEAADGGRLALALADADKAWRVAAQRRNEARRYYVAWQSARMRAAAAVRFLRGEGDQSSSRTEVVAEATVRLARSHGMSTAEALAHVEAAVKAFRSDPPAGDDSGQP